MIGSLSIDKRSWDRVQVGLKNLPTTLNSHAARTLARLTSRIVKRAQNYAPEDTGAMVSSIEMSKVRVGRRVAFTITLGGNGQVVIGDRTIPVGQYASIIHERYEDIIRDQHASGRKGGPSEKTLEKMARFPGKVGSGFLTRAAEEEEAIMPSDLIAMVKEVIKMEGLS
jgi:hypothetical protein